jgi:hypothetical protein
MKEENVMKRIIILVVVCLVASSAQAYVQDDLLITASHSGGVAWVRDADTPGTVGTAFQPGFETITTSGVQSDGEWIIATSQGNLFRRNPDSLASVNVEVGFGSINQLAVSPNDNVLVATAGGNVFIRNPDLSSAVVVPGGPFGNVTDIDAQSNNDFVFANDIGQAWRMDSTGANLNFNGAFGVISALAVAPNDNVVIGSPAGNVWLTNPDLSVSAFLGGGFGNITAIATQSDSDFVFANDVGNVWLFDSTGGGGVSKGFQPLASGIGALAVQSDDDIVVGRADGSVWIFDEDLVVSKHFSGVGTFGNPLTSISVQVPEPATLALLGLGSLFISRRKKGTR